MIIECEKLNKYFLSLFNDSLNSDMYTEIYMELYNEYGNNYIAFNYDNSYYIKTLITDEIGYDIVLNKDSLCNLIKIAQLWPKASVRIEKDQIELLNKEPSLRETNVDISYIFNECKEERMVSPEYSLSHEVNVKSFIKLLDICSMENKNTINIKPNGNKLIVSNECESIVSSIDCIQLSNDMSATCIKLNNKVVKLVLNFLNKLTSISFKLVLNTEHAFIVNSTNYEIFFIH